MNLLYLVSIWAAIYVDVGDTKRGEKNPHETGFHVSEKTYKAALEVRKILHY